MHSLGSAVHFALNLLNVGVPDSVRSSMRMADVVTEVNALAAYITFCHDDTSFTLSLGIYLQHNIDMLSDLGQECKE